MGILSASLIGRRVIELLRPHDLDVLLHDPYVSETEAAGLGVTPVGLDELFARSDTVSVHTPLLPETRGLVGRRLIESMRPGAVLINPTRSDRRPGRARRGRRGGPRPGRPRRHRPEVLPPQHPLWECDKVLITPHLAGSQGNEWRRLADLALAETARWASGAGFLHPVRRERAAIQA